MASTYTKPFMRPEDLVAQLRGRGLIIDDEPAALVALRTIGYYALSGYWYPMRQTSSGGSTEKSDIFIHGATFEHALRLFEFDRELRALAIEALEWIERVLKVEIALSLGPNNTFAHVDPAFMQGWFLKTNGNPPRSRHDKWVSSHQKKYSQRPDRHMKDFLAKYSDPLPIWVAIEAMDFGDASTLLSGLKGSYSNAIANRFSVTGGSDLVSMMRAMTQIRNTCAHHDRLWNRIHVNHPRMPVGHTAIFFAQLDGLGQVIWERTYASLLVLAYLHEEVRPGTDWPARMATHLKSLETGFGVTQDSLGAPAGWESHQIWS
jgi:abortive infection bacteriophage resistance protein